MCLNLPKKHGFFNLDIKQNLVFVSIIMSPNTGKKEKNNSFEISSLKAKRNLKVQVKATLMCNKKHIYNQVDITKIIIQKFKSH